MRHPNVVQVHEVGLADDLTAWYRMELLDGVTLREELRRRRALSLPLACATLRAAALGAGHLHSFGGVHRGGKLERLTQDLANEHGGPDNVTCVLARLGGG
ncbi:hypothetical protein [Sorangium sp. So ce1182]|uniref:hypothetical protein n=1 Tax=Sorangium sp. So ce1182 TaxID=3133334 RepID=UPI003F64203A